MSYYPLKSAIPVFIADDRMTVGTSVDDCGHLKYVLYTDSAEVELRIEYDRGIYHAALLETVAGALQGDDRELVRSSVIKLLDTLSIYRSVYLNHDVFQYLETLR